MKKIMSLMLGLALVIGTSAAAFAAEDKPTDGKMKKKGGKKGKKTTEAPKA